ncbi:hypothetical Protein YC6258_04019 [Gynuella sunshinyii YC6258]|uniref:Uncharacterized protein n=1 Tax=Gynuella sunshinyii YC6258 TaxID=1445510 RepID=A0A0C5V9L5_9GAMM|nr:hypothetical Protein YC6258_04019 [Gynuella sunshinyii YC6258]
MSNAIFEHRKTDSCTEYSPNTEHCQRLEWITFGSPSMNLKRDPEGTSSRDNPVSK